MKYRPKTGFVRVRYVYDYDTRRPFALRPSFSRDGKTRVFGAPSVRLFQSQTHVLSACVQ